jgi:hypothetical protein
MTKILGKRGRAPRALHRPSLQQSCSTRFDCCRQGPKQRQYPAETRQRIWKISKRAGRLAPKWPTFRSRTRRKNSGKKKVPAWPRSQSGKKFIAVVQGRVPNRQLLYHFGHACSSTPPVLAQQRPAKNNVKTVRCEGRSKRFITASVTVSSSLCGFSTRAVTRS